MLNYLGAEIYRLLHKKSLYIYFAILALDYVLLTYIRSGGFSDTSVVSDAADFFFYLPALVGGFLFAAIYTDDLNAKNLISLVGFGMNKLNIIVSKLILTLLFGILIFGLAPLLHIGAYALFGSIANADGWVSIYAISLKFLLMTIGFSALGGIVVYGLQRTTFAFVVYILLALGIMSGLISAALNSFAPFLTQFLLSNITDGIMLGMMQGNSVFAPLIEYCLYVVLAVALSTLVFSKKEMEF